MKYVWGEDKKEMKFQSLGFKIIGEFCFFEYGHQSEKGQYLEITNSPKGSLIGVLM